MTKSDINVFHVPEDYFLTFGDNRTQSADSRQCFGRCKSEDDILAYVPKENLSGRAEFAITWPLTNSRFLDNAPYKFVESE